MRILDEDNNVVLDDVLIMLTLEEVHQLVGLSRGLYERGRESRKGTDHFHIFDETTKKEVTIGIYFPDDLSGIHPRVVKLIEKDE